MNGSSTAAERTWTIGELLEWTTKHLANKGSESPRLDAEVLLAHALKARRIELYTRFHDVAGDDVRASYRDLIRRRVEGCPVAYLVGRKEFYALEFEVSGDVLIPRPDSEHVVMECLRVTEQVARPRILDLGTGSGNFPVTLAKHRPGAEITAIDLSERALATARRNAEKHGLTHRITFLHGDLFAPLSADTRFDVIVSNPPYIPTGEIANLQMGVRDYEPHLALDGGPDGFTVIERIAAGTHDRLEKSGHLIVEIGAPQEEGVRQRLTAAGLTLADTVHDYSGHPRVVVATRS